MPGVPYELLVEACAEGEVMLYAGTLIEGKEAQIKGFRERFPCVSVDTYHGTTGEQRERWLSETGAGRHIADIVQESDPGTMKKQAAEGLLLEYEISNAEHYPELPGITPFWNAFRYALVGIAWNTDIVTEEEAGLLQEWEGIIDPIWKGRAGVVDPGAGGVAFLPWYAWTELYGEEFIAAIGANEPRVFSGTNPASGALASGDIAVYFNASESGLVPLQLDGAPIRWSLPDPGVGPVGGDGISANAPHPNAAKLYMEYSYTEEGYALFQEFSGAPTRFNYDDRRAVANEPWYQLPGSALDYDPDEATAAREHVLDLFARYIGTGS
jgi:iron(III) transport system substrate-binding protein